MLRLVTVLIALLVLNSNGFAEPGDDIHTIYLVRHAEKLADGSKDPQLTECGKSRSKALAGMLSSVDLDGVYSSNYRRTIDTAQPTAVQQKIDIQIYDAEKLVDFAILLQAEKRDILVVGHSDTTATLAGLLIGDESYGAFDESIYDRLYQVVLFEGGGRNHLLLQNFRCSAANTALN